MEPVAPGPTLAAQLVEACSVAAHLKMRSAVMNTAANLATNVMLHHVKNQKTGSGDQKALKKLLLSSERWNNYS